VFLKKYIRNDTFSDLTSYPLATISDRFMMPNLIITFQAIKWTKFVKAWKNKNNIAKKYRVFPRKIGNNLIKRGRHQI
jgi:hypothetical protein